MQVDSVIIHQIFGFPPKHSLRELGIEFFYNLAKIFRVEIDEDWKLNELVLNIVRSYPGTALRKALFDGFTEKNLYYHVLYTEEVYILCYVLGLGEQENRPDAVRALLKRLDELRCGYTIEMGQLPDDKLIDRLNKIYYGKKKVQPERGKGQLLSF